MFIKKIPRILKISNKSILYLFLNTILLIIACYIFSNSNIKHILDIKKIIKLSKIIAFYSLIAIFYSLIFDIINEKFYKRHTLDRYNSIINKDITRISLSILTAISLLSVFLISSTFKSYFTKNSLIALNLSIVLFPVLKRILKYWQIVISFAISIFSLLIYLEVKGSVFLYDALFSSFIGINMINLINIYSCIYAKEDRKIGLQNYLSNFKDKKIILQIKSRFIISTLILSLVAILNANINNVFFIFIFLIYALIKKSMKNIVLYSSLYFEKFAKQYIITNLILLLGLLLSLID